MFRTTKKTTSNNAILALPLDPKRTKGVITNESGENIRWGSRQVAYTGDASGAIIFNNGRLERGKDTGRDPTAEVWVIGSAGGTIIIEEEWFDGS